MISKSRAENELAALIAWDDNWTDRDFDLESLR